MVYNFTEDIASVTSTWYMFAHDFCCINFHLKCIIRSCRASLDIQFEEFTDVFLCTLDYCWWIHSFLCHKDMEKPCVPEGLQSILRKTSITHIISKSYPYHCSILLISCCLLFCMTQTVFESFSCIIIIF